MSIVKPKTSAGKLPCQAYLGFNGQNGTMRLEIELNGEKKKYAPKKVKYLVIDEDFTEISGIKMGAPQDKGVKSNVCYGYENRYFKAKLKDGTSIAAGPWLTIKPKVELYGGKLVQFSFAILQKVQGTENDAEINAALASNKVVAKVSYHGMTSWEYGVLHKTHSTNDLAGFSITVGSFVTKSSKSGVQSQVPVFEAKKADDSSPEYIASVGVFLSEIEPYIKYVKNGGTSAELDEQAVPEASAEDFVSDDSWIPSAEPGDPSTGQPPLDDATF